MGVSSILLPPVGGGHLSSPPDAIIMALCLTYTAFSETSFTRVEVQATHLAFAGAVGEEEGPTVLFVVFDWSRVIIV